MRLEDNPRAAARRSGNAVVLLYGEEHANLELADELALDGFEVRRASDPAMLRARCDPGEVELVIFGRASRRGAGLDVLRGLRAGVLAPEAKPGLRALWMSPNGELAVVLRAFDAGADDVLCAPFAASGTVSGNATLQFTATDGQSGVRESQLLIDGSPVVSDSYGSQCSYANFAACPQSQVNSMTWNTNTVANGEHRVALRITDTAGNTHTVDDHPVTVSNPSATGASAGSEPPACAEAPGTHTKITVAAKHRLLVSDYRQRARLNGKLLGAGKPVSGATVEILTRPAVSGGKFSLLGHVTTRAHGQFKMTLPPGISRTVCLRYRALPGGVYTAALAVTQQVRAGVTLAVHPRAVESNGTIILTGNVLGGYISGAGKVVELQVLYLGSWRVFQTVRTRPNGQFTSFYSFLGGQGIFAFRASVRSENDYPYALGYSHPVRVRAG